MPRVLLLCALLSANLSFAAAPSSESLSLKMNDGRMVVGTVKSVDGGVAVIARTGGDWVFRLDQFTPESLVTLGANAAGLANIEERSAALEKENISLRALVLVCRRRI